MISAGEVHLPGRPTDILGLKSLAITAQRAFSSFRPGGVKVIAGAPVAEKDMTEQDFADLAAAGVGMLGEIGLGGVKTAPEAKKIVGWARRHGLQSTIHTGGPSIPGSGLIDAAVVLEADPDVIGHINGGHTALPFDQIVAFASAVRGRLKLFTTEMNLQHCMPSAQPLDWDNLNESFSAQIRLPAAAFNARHPASAGISF